jgi:hypothetical protein
MRRSKLTAFARTACFAAVVALADPGAGSASAQVAKDSPGVATTQQPRPIAGLGVTIGDTIATIKEVFKTDLDPELYQPTGSTPSSHAPSPLLRQATKGAWFFFDQQGRLERIRLQQPFIAPINGIKLGDTLAQLTEIRGKPIRRWSFGNDEAYLYPSDDVVYVRYDINKSGEVETIFLFK